MVKLKGLNYSSSTLNTIYLVLYWKKRTRTMFSVIVKLKISVRFFYNSGNQAHWWNLLLCMWKDTSPYPSVSWSLTQIIVRENLSQMSYWCQQPHNPCYLHKWTASSIVCVSHRQNMFTGWLYKTKHFFTCWGHNGLFLSIAK